MMITMEVYMVAEDGLVGPYANIHELPPDFDGNVVVYRSDEIDGEMEYTMQMGTFACVRSEHKKRGW